MPGNQVLISEQVLRRVYADARRAYPDECCGWLTAPTGSDAVDTMRACDNAQDAGDHPTAADRSARAAYVISGADLLELNRSFSTDNPARVIYHSHPNGRAYFSATDREVAMSPWQDGPAYPVQQLVVGIDAERVTEAALFDWSDDASDFVELARFDGAQV